MSAPLLRRRLSQGQPVVRRLHNTEELRIVELRRRVHLIEDLEIEFDPKKRMNLAWELQKVYTEEAPVIPLYYRSDVSVVPPNLKNYRPSGHQFHETGKIEEWTLE